MLSPDEITQTTEALEPLPRISDQRSASHGRRQHSLQQKQTDELPALAFDTPNARVAWKQVTQLRAENAHLRNSEAARRSELQRLQTEHNQLKLEFEKEVAIIQNGHSQEITYYQDRLQALQEEHDQLQTSLTELEQRYQELQDSFPDAVNSQARQLMTEATQTALLAPEQAPALLHDVVKTVELQVRQEEVKQLAEIHYLKREVQRLVQLLEQERLQINTERQHLAALQYSAHEQAELRQKTLQARLHMRWRLISVTTSLGLVGLLVVLQLVCLVVLHVPLASLTSIALIAPVVLCVALAFVLKTPLALLRQIYISAPHKKKIEA